MMTMTDRAALEALAARVEALQGPNMEVDAEIKEAVNHSWDYAADWGPRGHEVPRAHAYTASIDAAMTLVPEGWSFSLGEMMGLPLNLRWRCHLRDHNNPDAATRKWVDRDCATPSIAICAAALKALAQGESERLIEAKLQAVEARTDTKFERLIGKIDALSVTMSGVATELGKLDTKIGGVDVHARSAKTTIIATIIGAAIGIVGLAFAAVSI